MQLRTSLPRPDLYVERDDQRGWRLRGDGKSDRRSDSEYDRDTSGVYSFTGLANGSYTVTPTKSGFVMTPASLAVTINGANATANFTSAQTFTLSGTISGAGGSGATVNLTGATTASNDGRTPLACTASLDWPMAATRSRRRSQVS